MSARTPEHELLELHDRFCGGFAEKNPERVLSTVADTPDLVVVTSEDTILRGVTELREFLDGYVHGPTVYSWSWQVREPSCSGACGRMLAVGTETAATPDRQLQAPYRMTLVAERARRGWLLVQVHGSSPHHA